MSLTLTHNAHKSVYCTVAQCIKDERPGYELDDWVSEEQMQKAIETDECWTLQWYPDTPVGSILLSAADLDVLMQQANKIDESNN